MRAQGAAAPTCAAPCPAGSTRCLWEEEASACYHPRCRCLQGTGQSQGNTAGPCPHPAALRRPCPRAKPAQGRNTTQCSSPPGPPSPWQWPRQGPSCSSNSSTRCRTPTACRAGEIPSIAAAIKARTLVLVVRRAGGGCTQPYLSKLAELNMNLCGCFRQPALTHLDAPLCYAGGPCLLEAQSRFIPPWMVLFSPPTRPWRPFTLPWATRRGSSPLRHGTPCRLKRLRMRGWLACRCVPGKAQGAQGPLGVCMGLNTMGSLAADAPANEVGEIASEPVPCPHPPAGPEPHSLIQHLATWLSGPAAPTASTPTTSSPAPAPAAAAGRRAAGPCKQPALHPAQPHRPAAEPDWAGG